jgi:hypothetical protein
VPPVLSWFGWDLRTGSFLFTALSCCEIAYFFYAKLLGFFALRTCAALALGDADLSCAKTMQLQARTIKLTQQGGAAWGLLRRLTTTPVQHPVLQLAEAFSQALLLEDGFVCGGEVQLVDKISAREEVP